MHFAEKQWSMTCSLNNNFGLADNFQRTLGLTSQTKNKLHFFFSLLVHVLFFFPPLTQTA